MHQLFDRASDDRDRAEMPTQGPDELDFADEEPNALGQIKKKVSRTEPPSMTMATLSPKLPSKMISKNLPLKNK